MNRLIEGCAGLIVVLCLLNGLLPGGDSAADRASSIKLGYEGRTRFVTWDNLYLDDKTQHTHQTFIRQRTRLSLVWAVSENVELGLRVANELRYYFVPVGRDFNLHEGFIDNLYLKWHGPSNLPVILTLGRQDMTLGEGFLVKEGNPADELRSSFFNALRADILLRENSHLTFFYAYQPEKDDLLPVVHAQKQSLVEQTEEGLGVYFSGNFGSYDLDGYLIQKTVRGTEIRLPSSRIQTLGARSVVRLVKMLSLSVEGAYQFGSLGDVGRRAFGGYAHLDYTSDCPTCPLQILSLGFVYLSGEDPQTEQWEAWDPLFGRWPLWSDSYVYTLVGEQEGRFAYWSNLITVYQAVTISLMKNISLELAYHYMMADKIPDRSISGSAEMGKERGGLLKTRLNLAFHKNLTGHFTWETFSPGDFYDPDAMRTQWLRFELMVKI